MSDYAKYVGEDGKETEQKGAKTYNSGYVYGAVLNATMGSFFFGYVMSAFNPISAYVKESAFGEVLPQILINLMTSFVPLGAGAGALTAGKLAAILGRRKLMFILDLVSLIGTALTLLPIAVSLVIGRLIQGYCVGANSSLVPLYINEVSPNEIGGTLGTFNQLLITIGVLIPPLLALIGDANSKYYLVILGVAALSPAIRIIGNLFFFKHETPKYLISLSQTDEAEGALTKIYEDGRAKRELSSLNRQNHLDNESGKLSVKDLVGSKFGRRLFVGIMVAVFQQLSGINAIIFFSNNIFKQSEDGDEKEREFKAVIDTVIMDILQILGTIVAGLIIEKFGRKSLLTGGMASVSILLGLFGVISFVNEKSPLLKFMIWLFILAFGFSVGPVPWVYIADILPDIAIGFAVLGNWASTFIISLVFPIISGPDALGMGGGMIVFAVASALGAIFMAVAVKETKGKSEAEISLIFSKENSSSVGTFA